MTERSLRRRAGAAVLVAALACGAAACSIEPETIRSYNPSQGVNLDHNTVKLRNLVVVAQSPTQGYLAGAVNSSVPDAIVGGNATMLNPDGSDADSLTLSPSRQIDVQPGQVLLLQDSGLSVQGKLQAGQSVRLILNFSQAGMASIVVPVLSSQQPDYAGVTPQTPTATPGH